MKIYVASSWRNDRQPIVVEFLRSLGHDVYDFRNPSPGNKGFSWRRVADRNQLTQPGLFRDTVLTHPIAVEGFNHDMTALRAAECTVLVLPCGRSAHLELGYATGAGQKTIVLFDELIDEPELMYLMNTSLATSFAELKAFLEEDDRS